MKKTIEITENMLDVVRELRRVILDRVDVHEKVRSKLSNKILISSPITRQSEQWRDKGFLVHITPAPVKPK